MAANFEGQSAMITIKYFLAFFCIVKKQVVHRDLLKPSQSLPGPISVNKKLDQRCTGVSQCKTSLTTGFHNHVLRQLDVNSATVNYSAFWRSCWSVRSAVLQPGPSVLIHGFSPGPVLFNKLVSHDTHN